jgi:hypothetical protein
MDRFSFEEPASQHWGNDYTMLARSAIRYETLMAEVDRGCIGRSRHSVEIPPPRYCLKGIVTRSLLSLVWWRQ